jgi:hypothetical protein
MSNKFKLVISGRKQSGKGSIAKYTLCEYVNSKIGKKRFILEKVGDKVLVFDTFNNNRAIDFDYPNEESTNIFNTFSIKIYSFADPLKDFCINVFGLSPTQMYGTDDDKNSTTHISWDDMPEEIRIKYSKNKRGSFR